MTRRPRISSLTGTGAERIRWNLRDLYRSPAEQKQHFQELQARVAKFSRRYRGRVSSLGGRALGNALSRYESIQEEIGRGSTYAYLYWCTRVDLPARGALLQAARETASLLGQQLLFLELEWAALPERRARLLMKSRALEPYRHFLEQLRLQRPHLLSEAEERVLSEKSVTGFEAWGRFFNETLAAARFPDRGRDLTEQEVLSRLYSSRRRTRKEAALSFTRGLRRQLRELTFVFNTILADKASTDRLRRYPHWLAGRNLANEISDQAVKTLIRAVESRYDLVARYYRLKRRLLGLRRLYDYDRYAPLGETDTRYSWRQARDLVLDAYRRFHPEMGRIASLFFGRRWIDAPAAEGKIPGAFSHGAVPSVHPYILLNFTGNIRDVQTLAHELGHGVHQYLARRQGYLQSGTPLTTAETASVFGEMLVFDRLLSREPDPHTRLRLLAGKIDDSMATVFRQVAMNRFEDGIHSLRRSRGELSVEDFSRIWLETQNAMFQGSVRLTNNYSIWWSYIPHFVRTPGYVYAYAFGELLVLALYARYRKEGSTFADRYLLLLAAGGSDRPHRLLAPLGVDLNDPGFWAEGLGAIEELVAQAESLAKRSR